MKPFHDLTLPIICMIAFFGMAGGALLGPVLPAMVEPLHTTREMVGMILGVYTFSTALSMLLMSCFVDRFGRKNILIPCLLINGAAGTAGYFAPNLTVLLILRLVQGIGIAGMMPVAMTMIGEMYSGLDRVHAMGRMSMTTAIGSVSAPLIGGSMAAFGWNYPFLFYALTIPLAVIVVIFLPETNPVATKRKTGFSEMLGTLKDFRVAYTIFLGFAIFFLLYTIVIYVPFMLKDSFGFTAKDAGLALGIQGAAMALVASQAKQLSSRFPKHLVIGSGFFLTSIALAGLPWAGSIQVMLLMLLVFGAGFGMIQPVLNTLVTQIAPKGMMGSVVSVFNTMKYVGQTAAPAVLAIVLLQFDLKGVFLSSSLFGLVVAASMYLSGNRFSDIK
ncbi:MAG: MFS transporter [Methanosarcinaceae archaeon]|nr:MFS transporter [Methanosarcinaceae archaeon]